MTDDSVMTAYYREWLDGSEDALAAIIREYRDPLTHFICSIVRNYTDAEEIASDTFVQLALKKKTFRGDSAFRTYLFAIGRNRAVDLVRKRERRGEIIGESPEDRADGEMLDAQILRTERDAHLHSAISELCEDYRTVLYLVYFEDMNAESAGKVMKKNRKQTENLLYRAKKALRAILEKDGYGYEGL